LGTAEAARDETGEIKAGTKNTTMQRLDTTTPRTKRE